MIHIEILGENDAKCFLQDFSEIYEDKGLPGLSKALEEGRYKTEGMPDDTADS